MIKDAADEAEAKRLKLPALAEGMTKSDNTIGARCQRARAH